MEKFIKAFIEIDSEIQKSIINKIKANKKLSITELKYLSTYLDFKKRREKNVRK